MRALKGVSHPSVVRSFVRSHPLSPLPIRRSPLLPSIHNSSLERNPQRPAPPITTHPLSQNPPNIPTTHITTHFWLVSNPISLSCSSVASFSLALSFSCASTGNQSSMKFIRPQSTFARGNKEKGRQSGLVKSQGRQQNTHIHRPSPQSAPYTSDSPPVASSASSPSTVRKRGVHTRDG